MGRWWRTWRRPEGGSGGSGDLGSCDGVSWSRSGASGAWGRVRCGGVVGNGRAVGASVVQGGSGSAAACGSGLLCCASRAIREAPVAPGGPRAVVVGIRGGGRYYRSSRTCRVGVLCRMRWVWRRWRQTVRVLWL